MKKESTSTILIVATIAVLAVIGAHYAGLFATTASRACDDDFLQLGETLGLESTCAHYSVTVTEFSIDGHQVGVSMDLNGNMQSHIFSTGESKTFEPYGCDELWTITCDSLWANPQGAQFEICYEVPTHDPTITISGAPVGSITEGTQIDVTCAWDYDGYSDRGSVFLGRYSTLDQFPQVIGTHPSAADTGTHTFDITVTNVDADTPNVIYFCSLSKSNSGQIAEDWSEPFTIIDSTTTVPCPGLPPCTSDLSIFHECCAGDVWSCSYNNYDGEGYRVQWQLWDECTGGCECDGASTNQECECADSSPPCSGMSTCNRDHFMCEACCNGDVWRCWNHYHWELKTECTADETCECIGECQICSCEAEPSPTPTPSPADIDDATDTLTFDRTSYKLGDTVIMYATGTNVGGEMWYGDVRFRVMTPDGSTHLSTKSGEVTVPSQSSTTYSEQFVLPTSGPEGDWSVQSKWITQDGRVDAMSSVLTMGETEGDDDTQMMIYGGMLLFIAILYIALRKSQQRR